MIVLLVVLSDLVCAFVGAGIMGLVWRMSIVKKQIADYHVHEEHQRSLHTQVTIPAQPREMETVTAVGVRTAVTQIMQKRGWPIQEHEGAEVAINGRHRLDTRAVRVVRRSSS